jgi:hypothetical protein
MVGLVVALPLLLSAACTIRVEGQSSAGTASSSAPAPRTKASDESPPTIPAPAPTDEQLPDGSGFPADTSDKGGPAQPGSGSDSGQMRVEGVRLASHNGVDRLVIDLSTDAVPAWTLRYGEASGPGGGPVDIAGDAFLRLSLQTGDPGNGSHTSVNSSPGPIAAVLTTGSFEGTEEVLIGVRGGAAPFRAFALTDPGRIVIDVRPAG